MTLRRVLLHTVLVAGGVLVGAVGPARAGTITVLTPAGGREGVSARRRDAGRPVGAGDRPTARRENLGWCRGETKT